MSTNKTQNYQLHAWTAEDEGHLSELNENFAKLDERAVQIVIGSYIGDGQGERAFDLGFPPKAVILVNDIGVFNSSGTYGGVAGAGWSNDDFQLTANGFLLKRAASPLYRNSKNAAYFYVALR